MGFPFMVRGIRLSFDSIERDLEGAAASLGAPGWLVFLSISLPLAIPGLLSGAVLAFGRSLGEFGATITFVSSIPGETRTISSTIYALLQTPEGDSAVLRLCAVSLILSFGSFDPVGIADPRRAQAAGAMTGIEFRARLRLGDFALDAEFIGEGRVTGPVRSIGIGQKHDSALDRRPVAA